MMSKSWQDTKVSMVANAWGTTPRNISIGEILRNIQGGKWAKPIATIREVYNEALAMEGPQEAKKAIEELKKNLPGFPRHGCFCQAKKRKAGRAIGVDDHRPRQQPEQRCDPRHLGQ